ncbi:hypothetical protein RINTU1_08200 [Candidatus Regiella insecticola]|uniref:Uncharacterized protein n=1 Tax=Candidatus Regiella insecticola TaxID=138073 RepID=A0A6L2ZMC9_9ENTR|nr:hypothetical protein RINTU1_08200 [Candidatus Regiella insecticola]
MLAESRSMSTLIGLTPWQPKATSKANGICFSKKIFIYSNEK